MESKYMTQREKLLKLSHDLGFALDTIESLKIAKPQTANDYIVNQSLQRDMQAISDLCCRYAHLAAVTT